MKPESAQPPRPLQPNRTRKRLPDLLRWAAAGFVALVAIGLGAPSIALPPPPVPAGGAPSATPSQMPAATSQLPAGASIALVVDDGFSSAKTTDPGARIRFHLKDSIAVGSVTVAPAGTPGELRVVSIERAAAPDVDGTVRIYLDGITLPDGRKLPLRAVHEFLSIELTASQAEANSWTDTAKDIFIPGHQLYRLVARKGRDLTVPAGSILRARTTSTIVATGPTTYAIQTPPPFTLQMDPVYSDFTPIPLYTVAPRPTRPAQRPSPSPTPTPAPSVSPVPAPAAATGSPHS